MRILSTIIIILGCIHIGFTQTKHTFLRFSSTAPLIDFEDSDEDCTGFLYLDITKDINSVKVFLITAKHNLLIYNETTENYQLKYNKFKLLRYLVSKDSVLKKNILEIDLEGLDKINKVKYSTDKDIIAIEIQSADIRLYNNNLVRNILGGGAKEGSINAWAKKTSIDFKDVFEGSDVYLVGYPRSIGLNIQPQYDINRPLFRRGIVAGLNNNNKTIIIDAASFDGNSGGPVIQLANNNYKVIGILIQNIPVSPNGRYVGNSGYSVVEPISSIEELLKKFK